VLTLLDDRTAINDDDAIGSFNGAQPVCNDDHRSAFQVGIYCLLNLNIYQPEDVLTPRFLHDAQLNMFTHTHTHTHDYTHVCTKYMSYLLMYICGHD